jgi:hypothetical protein
MRAFVALLFVAALAAGCVQDETPSPTSQAPAPAMERVRLDPPASLEFSPEKILGRVDLGAEPSIAAGLDGTIYVTTPLAMWRSDDNGTTWVDLGGPVCPLGAPACPGAETSGAPEGLEGGGDADVWITPDGRVHWLGLFGSDANIPYQYSDDRGVTWSEPYDVSDGTGADREWITARPDGTLFASWRNGDPSTIRMAASYDNGMTWTEPLDIADDTRQGGIATDPSSPALALAHDAAGTVAVARSLDDGTTWDSVVVARNPRQGHVFPVTAFDAAGTLYLAYAADKDPTLPTQTGGLIRPYERTSVYVHVSHDKGLTWSNATQVNPPGTTAWFPWIAAGAQGKVVLSWYQNDRGLPRYTADEVYVMVGVSLDADLPDPRFAAFRASPEPVHMGPECREVPPCTRSLLDFFEVAIHPDGYPIVAWAEDLWPAPLIDVAFAKVTSGPNLLEPPEFRAAVAS